MSSPQERHRPTHGLQFHRELADDGILQRLLESSGHDYS
jgi:hypothetical protein